MKQTKHRLWMELEQGNVYCTSCSDYVYDAELLVFVLTCRAILHCIRHLKICNDKWNLILLLASCRSFFLNLICKKFCNLNIVWPLQLSYHFIFYVLLPYIIYVMQSDRFSQCPAFLSQTAKELDKKVQRKIAVAVQNVKPLYFLSRPFEIICGKRTL